MILSLLEHKPLRTFIGRLIHWPGEVVTTVRETAVTAATWSGVACAVVIGSLVVLAGCMVVRTMRGK